MNPHMQGSSMLNDPHLMKFLSDHAHHERKRPLAIFDCDGTVIKGDIGEAMLYYQLEHFHFLSSPAKVWHDHPDPQELERLYTALANTTPGDRKEHPAHESFAHMVLDWYFGQIAAGQVEKACADIVRLLAGFSQEEVRRIAEATFMSESSAPLAQRTLGGFPRPQGIRFIREAVDLLRALQTMRFEIWAVSGSNRWSVESVFSRLGVQPDHVLGIDLESNDGRFTDRVIQPVPIRENKVEAFKSKESRTPALVASDSRNDIPLLQYSSGLKVYVNSRRKSSVEFFSSPGIVRDDTWVVIEHPTIKE